MKRILLTLLGLMALGGLARADIVYVTAACSNVTSTTVCNSAINPDFNANGIRVYTDAAAGFTSAVSTKPDGPITPGGRYFSNSFSNSTPDLDGLTISPVLGVPGGVYKLYHIYSSAAGNVSTNLLVGATNLEGCTLSFEQTDKFQRSYGVAVGGKHVYQLLGFVTNNPGATAPRIRFYFLGGLVNATAQARLVVDTFKFQLYEPCTDIPTVGVTGPLSASENTVIVTGVAAGATEVTVYQDTGTGMVQIGKKVGGVTAGNNSVTVSGLAKGAKVAATQTIGAVEGCKPQDGYGVQVGGGANPRLRVALSLRENPTATGPAGAVGTNGWNSNIHFIPASSVLSGSCPGAGTLTIYPSNDWQTVTIPGRESVGNVASVNGTVVPNGGFYWGGLSFSVKVYAYRALPGPAITIYSGTPAQSAEVTSAGSFGVNWSWPAVTGAQGYRLLRNLYGGDPAFDEYTDVASNTFNDDNSTWLSGNTVTPSGYQSVPSVQWNPTVVTTNIAGSWAVLESIAFASVDPTDTGPFDIYIDNLANGANGIYQDFEGFVAGTGPGVIFNQPSYSGTTSGNILGAPNTADISNLAADGGTKSLRVRWQFVDATTNRWMRFNTFTTSVMPSPLVNLNEPISFRILMQPVGATPTPPPAPVLTVTKVGSDVVLSWEGTHNLQQATDVAGPYANVTGVTRGPYTITNPTGQRFYRLVN